MYFKLLPKAGSHADKVAGKVVIYKASDEHVFKGEANLAKMFPGKFEEVKVGLDGELPKPEPKPEPKPKPELKKAPVSEKIKGTPAPAPTAASAPVTVKSLGRDITKRFPRAEEEDFKVFADNGAFWVTEADEPDKALNTEPLKKSGVLKFIDSYLAK